MSDSDNSVDSSPMATDDDASFKLSEFRICPQTAQQLQEAKGITLLFPIQARCFDAVYDRRDVLARSRTGTGKTLAFALPLVEYLCASKKFKTEKPRRPPLVLCLLPTRELAQQVAADFVILQLNRFSTVCIYGGAPEYQQIRDINKGLDVLVATPGRLLDFVQREIVNLTKVKSVVLDEADKMLEMGFKDDVDSILGAVQQGSKDAEKRKIQFLLFTATFPDWIHHLSESYMSADKETIDTVESGTIQTALTVEHLVIQCPRPSRMELLRDVVTCYGGRTGRCIVFTDTRAQANEIATNSGISKICQVIHGDIQQSQRDTTLKAFKESKFQVLVATDVAARGLHIDNVDLIINMALPQDLDAYIHRSGRTGRAGNTGCAITFIHSNDFRGVKIIEEHTGLTIKRVAPPQPDELARKLGMDMAKELLAKDIPKAMIGRFRPAAKKLLSEADDAEEAIARCLCTLCEYDKPLNCENRSAISGREGFRTYTLHYTGRPIESKGHAYRELRRFTNDDELVEKFSFMSLLKSGEGAVFDVPEEAIAVMEKCLERKESLESGGKSGTKFWNVSVKPCAQLPDIVDEARHLGAVRGSSRGGRGISRGISRGRGPGESGGFKRPRDSTTGGGRGFKRGKIM